ncbi:hypothetical protein [uncultured Olleya sp.]|uniref:hypothetical protein n=1 Tax=uncultured Olleya sp. TaxID=757243 RepID=UPI0025976875|nr:hypothetical protein [uncultured Olleya sp.]
MKFIPPLEIASKIMTLIEESDKELILVSPYVELSNWNKMKKCIDRAIKRGVKIIFVARKNAKQNLSFLKQSGIKLILVNDLHAKLYINDSYGIVTSQNIVYYSDINSIDIAYRTINSEQRLELIDFINNYVLNNRLEVDVKKSIKILDINSTYKKVKLTSNQLEELSVFFNRKYNKIKFVTTDSYIFSKHLISFADVIINGSYTIKTHKKRNENINEFIDEIKTFDLNLKNQFEVKLDSEHNRFYYIDFYPKENFQIEGLIKDFCLITEAVVNSKYANRTEKSASAIIIHG